MLLSEELPKKVESITPYTMALIAKYVARHRLRETRLLDTIADFLVKKAEYLDSKVPNHFQQVLDISHTGCVVVWHIKKIKFQTKI